MQFIPIRFIFTNKLSEDDKLLLAFDSFVLSEATGRDISFGKIIHGDDHSPLKVRTAARCSEVRTCIEKIAALLSSPRHKPEWRRWPLVLMASGSRHSATTKPRG